MHTDVDRAPSSTPQIEHREAQPYLAVRREVTETVQVAVDGAFPALFEWLGQRAIKPAGPPFIRVNEVDQKGEPLELETGVPVAAEVFADGIVHAGVLPAGRYATLIHVGPYRSETETDIGDTRERLLTWARETGLELGEPSARGTALRCCVDHLLISPGTEPDYTKWKTELAYLIVDGYAAAVS